MRDMFYTIVAFYVIIKIHRFRRRKAKSFDFCCDMRIRRKAWVRPELEKCEFFVDEPIKNRGSWSEQFKKKQPLNLELGCGKGSFIAQKASAEQNVNFIAVDIKSEMLGLAKRTVERTFSEKNLPVNNVILTAYNIERIGLVFGEGDIFERIYINFCNPWPRAKHQKRRLTHTRQLEQYKEILAKGGEIHFKTDDDALFEDSIAYFKDTGFEVIYLTYDLHNSDVKGNVETEHEKMFSKEGIKIKFLIAKLS